MNIVPENSACAWQAPQNVVLKPEYFRRRNKWQFAARITGSMKIHSVGKMEILWTLNQVAHTATTVLCKLYQKVFCNHFPGYPVHDFLNCFDDQTSASSRLQPHFGSAHFDWTINAWQQQMHISHKNIVLFCIYMFRRHFRQLQGALHQNKKLTKI